MTDLKTVYRKIVAFEQASISLQYVEEWKYYELTTWKPKGQETPGTWTASSSSWLRAPRRRQKQRRDRGT